MISYINPADFTTLRSYNHQFFPWFPEFIFILYINNIGMSAGNYSFMSDPEQMPLKMERHALTDFTNLIFRAIQNKDYSFLDLMVDWEEEVAAYLAAGGISDNFLQKIAKIRVSELSDSACATLFRVIDSVNDSPWLVAYAPQFAAEVMARGIQPPKSLACLLEAGLHSRTG
jgi:hypothetical protein